MKRTIRKINAITQAQLIKLLIEGAYSCQELADQTGLHYVTVLQYTRELYRFGAAHIAAWEDDARGRSLVKIYKLGEGKDAKRRRLTDSQRQERYRDKKRALAMNQVLGGAAAFVQSANGGVRLAA